MGKMELGIEDIATALGLPASKIERWIRQGHIPLIRSGPLCSFDPDALRKWAAQNHLNLCLESGPARDPRPLAAESLVSALTRGGVYHRIRGAGVPEILAEVTGRLAFIPAPHKADLLQRLLEREKLTSTGIGKGVAIPHPRDPAGPLVAAPHIAACFLCTPVDFRAVDDRPVWVLFVMLCPTVKEHLHLLSRLSYGLRNADFIAFLESAPSAAALLHAVAAFEGQLDPATGGR
jgi:PTS system nitrogen regulatory IIA component